MNKTDMQAWLRESPVRPIPGGFLGEPLGEECRYCGPMRERVEANGYVFYDHSPNCPWLAAVKGHQTNG